jgi:hypothetical protein
MKRHFCDTGNDKKATALPVPASLQRSIHFFGSLQLQENAGNQKRYRTPIKKGNTLIQITY